MRAGRPSGCEVSSRNGIADTEGSDGDPGPTTSDSIASRVQSFYPSDGSASDAIRCCLGTIPSCLA